MQEFVIPGDRIATSARLGPGLLPQADGTSQAYTPGFVHETPRATYIHANTRRYTAGVRDYVVGTVVQRVGDAYRVSLQERTRPARLPLLAFAGVTKKTRPNLAVGEHVYACVVSASPAGDVELACMDTTSGTLAGFGPLKEGHIVRIGLALARRLLLEGDPSLAKLGKKYTFELAVGVNGLVWVRGEDARATLAVARALEKLDGSPGVV